MTVVSSVSLDKDPADLRTAPSVTLEFTHTQLAKALVNSSNIGLTADREHVSRRSIRKLELQDPEHMRTSFTFISMMSS